MAIIKYGRVNPRIPAAPKVPKVPAIVPMGQSDIDAGSSAGSGFNVGIDFGSTGGTGRASSSLAASNLTFKVGQAKAQAARNKAQAEYIKTLLAGTGYRAGIDELLGKVGEQETAEKAGVTSQYGTARKTLEDLYGTSTAPSATSARGMTAAGYDTLKNWLAANAPTAYATATRAVPVSTENALAAYQRAQGVSSAPTDAQIAAMNVAAQGGAANYNNLLNTLAASERSSAASRAAEAQMAQNLANARLTAGYTSALGGLNAQEAAALAALTQKYGGTRLSAEQAAITRRTTLEDALRALTGY